MHSKLSQSAGALAALVLAVGIGSAPAARAQAVYAQPQAAAAAFVAAVRDHDEAAMRTVLGAQWRSIMPPGGADDRDVQAFLRAAGEKTAITPERDGMVEVTVGNDPWTLPVPLVRRDGGWSFDLERAREQIVVRRIGRNELYAMQAMLAYVDAQRDYALADRNGDGVLEYAQKLLSSPGRRDGLIWDARLGDSPLGPEFLPRKPGTGYHGYRFRILTGQGPQAPGGARDYMLGGKLLTGFALIGWPVEWGNTGVMTFIVDSAGRLYQRDFGPATSLIVQDILRFNPDAAWTAVRP
jgi:hypothetical protein